MPTRSALSDAITAERFAQIRRLFEIAIALPSDSRALLLATACATDTELRVAVERMLAAAELTRQILDQPALGAEAEPAAARNGLVPGFSRIGCYRIVSVLGEGGMGVVYEAEQENPRRTVALKVIRPGLAGAELLRRFEQEAQALGRLQHPGIAQIYQAGTADAGPEPQPYFAMELLRGESLLQYAETHQLNTRKRLELISKICEAVHHAHQRGIIHRDLKPGNLLVDASGQPKILDFGVARTMDSDRQATLQTSLGQLIGTLAYMSPEQTVGDPWQLDTRTDVYSLGVILFELLTGRLPYEISGRVHEAVTTIQERDPDRLSTLNRKYRGDIENIVSKALEKNRERRYTSAMAMADDIMRYLHNEPVMARPRGATYQLKKFASRHSALLAALAGVAAILIASTIMSTLAWAMARHSEQSAIRDRNQAIQEKQRADRESAVAREIQNFLQNDLLTRASPNGVSKHDPNLTIRTVLDRAAASLQGRFGEQPAVEASIRHTIGNSYFALGLYDEAIPNLTRALDLRIQTLGEEHPDTLESMEKLAVLYKEQCKEEEAEALMERLLGIRKHVLGENNPKTLETMQHVAGDKLRRYQYSEAEELVLRALTTARRVFGDKHPTTWSAIYSLAEVYDYEEKYPDEEHVLTDLLQLQQHICADTDDTELRLSYVYILRGRYSEAEVILKRLLREVQSAYGEEHRLVIRTKYWIALMYQSQGNLRQAQRLYKSLWPKLSTLGTRDYVTQDIKYELGVLYLQAGQLARAKSLLLEVWRMQKESVGGNDLFALQIAYDLALSSYKEGRLAQSQAIAEQVVQGYNSIGLDSWRKYECLTLVGQDLAMQKRYTEAEPLLQAGYDGMRKHEANIPALRRSDLSQGAKWIAQLYERWERPKEASAWRQKTNSAQPIGNMTEVRAIR